MTHLDTDLAVVCKLDGIPDQIQKDLIDSPCIPASGGKVHRDARFERQVFFFCQRLHGREHTVDHIAYGVLLCDELELSSFNFAQIEHVVDEAQEVMTTDSYSAKYLADLLRNFSIDIAQDKLCVAEDGIERRP